VASWIYSEIRWGNEDGSSRSLDAYGRNPYDPNYDDRRQHDREWVSAQQTKREWAKKHGTAPRSRTMEFRDEIHDKIFPSGELQSETNRHATDLLIGCPISHYDLWPNPHPFR
jgi:hypothetical protein